MVIDLCLRTHSPLDSLSQTFFFSSHDSLFLHAITTTSSKEKNSNTDTNTVRGPCGALAPSIQAPLSRHTHCKIPPPFFLFRSPCFFFLIKNNKHSINSFFGSLSVSPIRFHLNDRHIHLYFFYIKKKRRQQKNNNRQTDTRVKVHVEEFMEPLGKGPVPQR